MYFREDGLRDFARYAAIVAGVLLFVFVSFALRYEPIPTDANLGMLMVWDRYESRVCVVSFAGDNRLHCNVDTLPDAFGRKP